MNEKLKKESEDEGESELEEELNNSEEIIENSKFREFLNSSFEIDSKINEKQDVFHQDLEEDVFSMTSFSENEKKEETKYDVMSPDYKSVAEASMRMQESFAVRRPDFVDFEQQRIIPNRMQEQSFKINPELNELRQQQSFKDDYAVSQDFERLKETKTHSTFEQHENKKYEIR